MPRERIEGSPVARITRRLSPEKWATAVAMGEGDGGGSVWSVELSPRTTRPGLVLVQIERGDGTVEGVRTFTVNRPWTYTRTVVLAPNEEPPSLVVYEFLTQKLVWVRRRWRG
jgi:hypothetical protein